MFMRSLLPHSSPEPPRFLKHFLQIPPVLAVRKLCNQCFKLLERQETLPERRLFRATDFHALPLLDRLYVSGSLVKAAAGSGIQPGETAPEPMDPQLIPAQILDIHICDFQFS